MDLELAAITSILIASVTVVAGLHSNRRRMQIRTDDVIGRLRRVEKISSQLFEKIQLLEGHAGKYFNSLHDAGLSELFNIRGRLGEVLQDVRNHIVSNRFDDALELIKFLETPMAKPYPQLRKLSNAELDVLTDWQRGADQFVMSCVVKLGVISSKRGTTIVDRPERRQTVHTLDDLKRMLCEVRPN